MRQILFFTVVIAVLTSCGKKLYPGQTEAKRKDVPSVVGHFTKIPLVHQVGDLKWIHDQGNNALVLFKGAEDTLLTKMVDWLSRKMDENGDTATTVARFVEVPIAPFTLFTKKELKRQSRTDRERIVELAKYKTYSITLSEFLYKEDMTAAEVAALEGRKYVPVQTKSTTITTNPAVQPGKPVTPRTRAARLRKYN